MQPSVAPRVSRAPYAAVAGQAARAWRIRAVWCQLCRTAWSSRKNWHVSGVSKYSEIGAAGHRGLLRGLRAIGRNPSPAKTLSPR
jgi:hypothetical protein